MATGQSAMKRPDIPRQELASAPAQVSGLYIQPAAEMVGVSAASLRMWERFGLVHPARNAAGYRVYSMQDIERMLRIRELLADGIDTEGIRRLLEIRSDTPPSVTCPESTSLTLGARLRALRAARGDTLRRVAERTGLSPSYINSVERSLSSPSIASLQKLAAAFDTNVIALLGGAYQAPDTPLIRRVERTLLESSHGVTIEDLSTARSGLEPLMFTIAPGAGSDGAVSHAGEEVLLVLKGEFRLRLDGKTDYDLEPGDSMSFDSRRSHQFSNVGPLPTVVFWVNTPRTF
jgi:DNA-binding transcriptional MerR regulator/mannose-6-phosphate isomerase-like protein (cupin superfamily)